MKDFTANEAKCSICNKQSDMLTIMVNDKTLEKDYVCSDCLSKDEFKDATMEEVEDNLNQFVEMAAKYEDMLRSPEIQEMFSSVPPELEAFAMTPNKAFKMISDSITSLKIRKMQLESQNPSVETLGKELDKAVKNEDFEKAAKLKQQISNLNKKSK